MKQIGTIGFVHSVALLAVPWALWLELDVPIAVGRVLQGLAHTRVPRIGPH